MKLIKETIIDAKPLIVEEAGHRNYYIVGPFLQAELRNRNGRIYPLEILQREVARYTTEFINESRALGELGHPDSPQINLDRVSHMIVELSQDGNDFMGKAKVLGTPNGQIVKALLDEGIKLGVSTRGVGSLKSTSQGDIVGEDFFLATAADVVADPSAPSAFVRGIFENKEWVWQNGVLTEAQIASYQAELRGAPTKKAAEKKLVEAAVFEKFIRAIRVNT
jgi:hypothetical protein